MVDNVISSEIVLCCPKKWCSLKKRSTPLSLSLVVLPPININRFLLAVVPRNLFTFFYCAARQKSLENTGAYDKQVPTNKIFAAP